MNKLLLACLAMLAPVAAHAQAQPAAPAPAPAAVDGTVYDKALGSGWQNWSWAKTTLSADIGSARMPVMVEAQGYQALYLHHEPFSTAPFRSLNMLIQVVGSPSQVRVIAIVGGKPVPDKVKLVKLAPGGWTSVQIPLDALGAGNTTIDGIWVQNDSDQPAPHFYVADIAFKP